MADESTDNSANAVELAAELTIAWLGNPNVRAAAEDVPAFLKSMHATIGELSKPADTAPADTILEHVPAVPVRSSVKPDYLISLIDGRKLKSLKRHLSTHGLTPQEYRERYGLKPDYPMVAANYSAQRREVAQKLGLGRKGRGARGAGASATPVAPVKRGRRKAQAPAA
jgi:predicted transcriptional regulator